MGAILFGSFSAVAFLIYISEQFKLFPPMVSANFEFIRMCLVLLLPISYLASHYLLCLVVAYLYLCHLAVGLSLLSYQMFRFQEIPEFNEQMFSVLEEALFHAILRI